MCTAKILAVEVFATSLFLFISQEVFTTSLFLKTTFDIVLPKLLLPQIIFSHFPVYVVALLLIPYVNWTFASRELGYYFNMSEE